MTHQFEHTGQPFPCCPWCGLLDEDIFKARKRLMCGGSWVEFHHECPGCKARYEVQFFPSKQAGFNTGFRECDRDAETLADPQNTADPVEGIDIPSPVKSSDVLEPREFDRVRAIELAAWAIAHHSNDADRYGLYWGSGMAAVDDMPDILKDTAKTSMSEPLSVSTPGDDSAPAVEGTQLAEAFAVDIYRQYCWREFMDIDSGDFQEMLKKHGLIEEYTVTHEQVVAEEAPEECEAGDLAFRPTPYFRALLGQNQ